ncbi:MAG: hypothetical protein V3U03_04330 [Myxococcota bacterium]
MSDRIRGYVAALAVGALLLGSTAPAAAAEFDARSSHDVPIVFDVLVMRPLGLMMTMLGGVTWLMATPIVAMTRPTDIMKPFRMLVVRPAMFTFADPLGQHPDRN